MDKLVSFDICAAIIITILLISTYFRGMTKGKLNLHFIMLLIVSWSAAIFDIWAILLDNTGEGHIVQKYISHSFYLLLHNFTTPAYLAYIITLTDTWHIIKRNKTMLALLTVPFTVIALSLVENIFFHNVFYFSAGDAYTRGDSFFILYLSAALYFVFGLSYLFNYNGLFTRGRFVSLLFSFPMMLVALVVQLLKPEYPVENFANAISLMFISMMIQRPEEIIDTDTGLSKLSAYITDMRRAFSTNKKAEIILINITNYANLNRILSYDSMHQLLYDVSVKLQELNKDFMKNSNMYYLGSGKFRIVVGEDCFEHTVNMAEKINEAMKSNLVLNHMDINLVTCVCIACCPEDIRDVNSLIDFGNDLTSRFYNGQVLYASDLFKQQQYDIRHDIDTIIENALANHKFEVYYQPIYSVVEQRFNSAEALLRLKDDTYGFISPEIFIPAAEKSGAIHRIGAFVLNEVCAFIASDEFKKLKLDYIEVNLSVVQCMQSSLAGEVLSTIDKYKIEPSQLNLEITETAASYSQNALTDNLNILSDAGISFSLDDFGTGYSNMKRIASLPLHIVKLDKSFTNIEDNPRMTIVLKNTIHMIKDMNMKIVVEGIETENLVRQFSDMNCEYIQGYYYSRPLPKMDFVNFIKCAVG